jgi:hypothetical protein
LFKEEKLLLLNQAKSSKKWVDKESERSDKHALAPMSETQNSEDC